MHAIGELKYCPDCKMEKPLSAFGRSRSRPDGLTVYCKECRNRRQCERYSSDPMLRARKYRKTRERYEDDPSAHEEQLERQREWRREHYADPEFRAAENARHRERWRTSERRRTLKLESNRRWREENREECNAKHREYVRDRYHNDSAFREYLRNYFIQRRARKCASGGSFSVEQWEMLLDLCNNQCLACGKVLSLEADHIVPVSAGGMSDLTNIQPLCRSCNASKGTNTIDYRPDNVACIVEAAHI